MSRKDQATSIEAYHTESVQRLRSKSQRIICDLLKHNGPMTIRETMHILPMATKQNATSFSSIFSKLEEKGYLRRNAPRRCAITGHISIEWEFGCFAPKPKVRKRCPHCDGEL